MNLNDFMVEAVETVSRHNIVSSEWDRIRDAIRTVGGKLWGVCQPSTWSGGDWMYLIELSTYDQNELKIKLKAGEGVFRYTNLATYAGRYFPMVKINTTKNLIYFMTQDAFDGGELEFESRGIKLRFLKAYE